MKKPPDKPVPAQISRLEKVEDADQIPEAKVEANYGLRPEIARDPNIVVQTKMDANEKRHLAAQLPDKVKAAIYGYLDRHSGRKISNSEVAKFLQEDNPETAPLVAHLKRKSLADKIGALRK